MKIENPGEGVFTVAARDLPRIASALARRGLMLSLVSPGRWIVKGEPSSGERHTPAGGAVPPRSGPLH